ESATIFKLLRKPCSWIPTEMLRKCGRECSTARRSKNSRNEQDRSSLLKRAYEQRKGELNNDEKNAVYGIFGRDAIGCLRFCFSTGDASGCGHGLRQSVYQFNHLCASLPVLYRGGGRNYRRMPALGATSCAGQRQPCFGKPGQITGRR